jgi:Cys-tRNA(Pro) deacylase
VYLIGNNKIMTRPDYPITQAIRFLRDRKIAFRAHLYPFVEHGGTHHVSEYFLIPEHQVIKTLIMEFDDKRPFIMLMHGDCEVSTKQLARELGVKRVDPCDEKDANRYTGYMVGGISPFGTRTRLPVYGESTIFELDRIFINGGKRGFMVELKPQDLEKAFRVIKVNAAKNEAPGHLPARG